MSSNLLYCYKHPSSSSRQRRLTGTSSSTLECGTVPSGDVSNTATTVDEIKYVYELSFDFTKVTLDEAMSNVKYRLFNTISDGFHNKYVCCSDNSSSSGNDDDGTYRHSRGLTSETGIFAFALSPDPQDVEDTSGSACEASPPVQGYNVTCAPVIGRMTLYSNGTAPSTDVLSAIDDVMTGGDVNGAKLNATYVGKRSLDTTKTDGTCLSHCYFNQVRGILSNVKVPALGPMGIVIVVAASLCLVGVILAVRKRMTQKKQTQDIVFVETGDTDLGLSKENSPSDSGLSKDHHFFDFGVSKGDSYSDDGDEKKIQNTASILNDEDAEDVEIKLD